MIKTEPLPTPNGGLFWTLLTLASSLPPPPRASPASVATVCSSTHWKEEPSWSLSGHGPLRGVLLPLLRVLPPHKARFGGCCGGSFADPELAATGAHLCLMSLGHFSEDICVQFVFLLHGSLGSEVAGECEVPKGKCKIGMSFSSVPSGPEGASPRGGLCYSDPATSAGNSHSWEAGRPPPAEGLGP